MFNNWLKELKDFLYDFHVVSDDPNHITMEGVYHLNSSIQELTLKNDFKLKIIIDKSFPLVYPKIYSLDNSLEGFSHVNPDGELCLGVFIDNYLKLQHNPGLVNYFKLLVEPYLYSYEFYKRYKVMPFNERSHGIKGIFEFYYEYFGAKNMKEFSGLFLYVLKNDKYRGHQKCPCGSGKITRNCHGIFLKKVFNDKGDKAYAKLLTKDMEELINNVKRIKKEEKI